MSKNGLNGNASTFVESTAKLRTAEDKLRANRAVTAASDARIASAEEANEDRGATPELLAKGFADNSLMPLIDEFVREHEREAREFTGEKVERFFDFVITVLKEGKYIDDTHIVDLKKTASTTKQAEEAVAHAAQNVKGILGGMWNKLTGGPDQKIKQAAAQQSAPGAIEDGNDSLFIRNVKDTLALLNHQDNNVKLGLKDRICYKVANFCNDLGCKAVSNYLMRHVKKEEVDKIHRVEQALMGGVQRLAGDARTNDLAKGDSNTSIKVERAKVVSHAEKILQERQSKQGSGVQR